MKWLTYLFVGNAEILVIVGRVKVVKSVVSDVFTTGALTEIAE